MFRRQTNETTLRELDRRTSDGIVVTLLWDAASDRVSIAVTDAHANDTFAFEVEAAEALPAFHHPYAYAPSHNRDRALAA
jgi:carotenoid cleavage dioxygenase-like enzyme